MKNIGYYNGKIGLIEEMSIPMSDRACYFGDGIYDAAFSKNGKIFPLEEHLARFFRNADRLRLPLSITPGELEKLLLDLLSRVDGDNKFVYWQSSRGVAPRNHPFPDVPATLYITITPAKMIDVYEKIKLTECEDIRYRMCDIKTINLLPSVLASQKAEQEGCTEAVFHRGNTVTECAHSNISILKNGVFRTHPTTCDILPGIARAHLIKACKKHGIPVEERAFSMEELYAADEIIVSSSSKFCLSAYELCGVPVGGGDPTTLKILQDEVLDEFMNYVGLGRQA